MGHVLGDVRKSVLLGLVMPLAIVSLVGRISEMDLNELPFFSSKSTDGSWLVTVLQEGKPTEMTMEAYLCRVLPAEMPPSFEPEALKAQAVAARTYTCQSQLSAQKHEGALCTDSRCCQAYSTDAQLESLSQEEREKIQQAVTDTDGLVLTYQGAPIEATFFSSSGGRTEDAAAVWGRDYPYLRSVESPGEEESPYNESSIFLYRAELEELLDISLGEDWGQWVGELSYTSGGGVDRLILGDRSFSGTYLRRILGLNSTVFTVEPEPDGICFTTSGYGHRVGMSQYGANAMAEDGADFKEILSHYYGGTILLNYSEFVEE